MSETTQLIRYRDLVLRMQKSVMKKIKRKEENIKEIDALTWQKSKKIRKLSIVKHGIIDKVKKNKLKWEKKQKTIVKIDIITI